MLNINTITSLKSIRYAGYASLGILLGSISACGQNEIRGDVVIQQPASPASVVRAKSKEEADKLRVGQYHGVPARLEEKMALHAGNVANQSATDLYSRVNPELNQETYQQIHENAFQPTLAHPVSTFSIDVDTAAYSNVRRFIQSGRLPMKDAVRIEELINYFNYDYPQPADGQPFSVATEVATCPWNPQNRLVQIGLQGKRIATEDMPPSNLVFLIDVSGSMHDDLQLVKSAMITLTQNLRDKDRVAIVVYAGAAGMVLPSTPGTDKRSIIESLQNLQAGGSTAGAAGIKLAYQIAQQNFLREGNNRVIIATDGDFNVGTRSTTDLQRLIADKAKQGVFLSVLGFGHGNYNDTIAETLADKGNGNYSYIDSLQEAKKVLVNQMAGTLYTIAKDVKIQLQFNPRHVKEYRLIGYENRMLQREDFNNDKKDAGEIGVAHTVTALYEIVPNDKNKVTTDQLDFVKTDVLQHKAKDLMSVRLRYKNPDEHNSRLISISVPYLDTLAKTAASTNIRFAAAVAEIGLVLRDSPFKANANIHNVITRATAALGEDKENYRKDFVTLARQVEQLLRDKS